MEEAQKKREECVDSPPEKIGDCETQYIIDEVQCETDFRQCRSDCSEKY